MFYKVLNTPMIPVNKYLLRVNNTDTQITHLNVAFKISLLTNIFRWDDLSFNVTNILFNALCDLVLFIQFEKRGKNPWVLFMFFKLWEWYRIAQSVSSSGTCNIALCIHPSKPRPTDWSSWLMSLKLRQGKNKGNSLFGIYGQL